MFVFLLREIFSIGPRCEVTKIEKVNEPIIIINYLFLGGCSCNGHLHLNRGECGEASSSGCGNWSVPNFSSNHSLTYKQTIEYDFAILHKSCCENWSTPHFSSNRCFIDNQLYIDIDMYNCKQVLRGRLKHLPRRSTVELRCSVQVFFFRIKINNCSKISQTKDY